MDDQGGSGGVPLHDEDDDRQHRKPHVERPADKEPKPGPVRAADTDEASRLDRPGRDRARDRAHRGPEKGPE
ncbi:hypothetical protein [Streptomyces sp. RerS4]|uniref:hypothetical protein n=1 Tax=Streptomyces sp. RerS4 TaxID=2942449 RepID=UPI00201C4EB8|nr:hypothetical protein [Streptomyces sp. RerS4]UQX03931.1 hypothetical protein M4D82_28085 [Streptomyces sp. RerS4]